ncbi:MAG: hypothetical protein V3V52_05105, partial [Candidatus Adiutricales bacterium]
VGPKDEVLQRSQSIPSVIYIDAVYSFNSPVVIVPANGSAEPRPLQEQGWGHKPWFSVDGKWSFLSSSASCTHIEVIENLQNSRLKLEPHPIS